MTDARENRVLPEHFGISYQDESFTFFAADFRAVSGEGGLLVKS